MWGRPTSEHKHDDDIVNEGKNISYKTECPIYDPSSLQMNSTNEDEASNNILSQVKNYYPLNLNNYKNNSNNINEPKPKGFHPYYPSMDKNAMVSL